MLACRNYAVRFECYRTGVQIKKIRLVALLCARLSRVDCVTRRVYDELTGDKLTGSLFRPTATDRCQSQETFRLISVIP